jgi:hypothetical protein
VSAFTFSFRVPADEIPQPVVIALLRPGRGRHRDDHWHSAHAAQLLEDDWGRPSA